MNNVLLCRADYEADLELVVDVFTLNDMAKNSLSNAAEIAGRQALLDKLRTRFNRPGEPHRE